MPPPSRVIKAFFFPAVHLTALLNSTDNPAGTLVRLFVLTQKHSPFRKA